MYILWLLIAYHMKKKKPVTSAGNLSAKLLEGLAYLHFQIWLSNKHRSQKSKQKNPLWLLRNMLKNQKKKNLVFLCFAQFPQHPNFVLSNVLINTKLKWGIRPISFCGRGCNNRKFNRASPPQQFTPTGKPQGLARGFNQFLRFPVVRQWRKGQAFGLRSQWPSLEHNMISCNNSLGW